MATSKPKQQPPETPDVLDRILARLTESDDALVADWARALLQRGERGTSVRADEQPAEEPCSSTELQAKKKPARDEAR
jgi:hypothetical protein